MRIVDIHEPDTITNPLIKSGWERKETPIDKLYELYISKKEMLDDTRNLDR